MAKVLLTADEAAQTRLGSHKFDRKILGDHIEDAETEYVIDFIGRDFYAELVTQKDTASLTADNQALFDDRLKRLAGLSVLLEALPFIFSQITNAGVVQSSPHNSEPTSGKGYSEVKQAIFKKLQTARRETHIYICEAKEADDTKYPLYTADCSDCITGTATEPTAKHYGVNFDMYDD